MSSKERPPSSSGSGDAPLPPGWTKSYSNSQKRYFWYHASTKTSQWHAPTSLEAENPAVAKAEAERKAREEHGSDAAVQQFKASKSSDPAAKKRGADGEGRSGSGREEKKSKREHGRSSSKSAASSSERRSKDSGAALSAGPPPLLTGTTSVAVIVPYRDIHPEQNRASHLRRFIPHMLAFLKRQDGSKLRNYHIYIIEQSDDGRKFNRGKLLNIGFDIARRRRPMAHDVFIFHDVDLLPGNDLGSWYTRFAKNPLHIARCWDRYSNNPKYFGGIVSFSASDMRRINGYPNTFWGWGGEDDEMQKRCEKLRIAWESPPKGTIQDLENMDLTTKLNFLRKNKKWKCMVKWEAMDEHETTWKTNGLSDLQYQKLEEKSLDPEGGKATLITVDVKLNKDHWANDKCGVDYMGG